MNIKSLLITVKVGVCMLLACTLFSCETFHDNMDGCGMYLRFKYDYNMKKTDLFAERVKRVDVFFFNEKGILQEYLTEEGEVLSSPDYRMDISQLPRKKYQIITWAGWSDSYELEFKKGETKIDDLKLKLLYEDKLVNGTYASSHSDLWFGEVSIGSGDWNAGEKMVDLIKNTNHFHISVGSGNNAFSETELRGYTFHLTTGDGGYDYKNQPLSTNQLIYSPHKYVENENKKWMANINTMRILEDHPARLIIKSPDGRVILDLDLIPYIKEGSYEAEGEGMTFPEYLDRQDRFYIHLEIQHNIAVSITINGWTTWLQGTDI